MITQSELKSTLKYNPETGDFVRILTGDKVGHNHDGYTRISIRSRKYYAHRLAWLYIHGRWPDKEIDHINGVRNDNRLKNLRECTSRQNSHNTKIKSNNKSGYKGVSFCNKAKKYTARIRIQKKYLFLGYFDNPKDASDAYINKAKKVHGDFFRAKGLEH